jgi:recombination associated protein RdgC
MFKSLSIYTISPGWVPSLADMETALQAAQYVPCSPSQDRSIGWVPPRGETNGALVESVNAQRILKLMIETRSVPGTLVKAKAQEAADHIEATTGRKPGKREMKELREDALQALLPQAFPKLSAVLVWVNLVDGWLVIDASSQGKCDEVVTALVRAFDGLGLSMLQTTKTPQACMTLWLSTDTDAWLSEQRALPDEFDIGRSAVLRSADEDKALVKFDRHHLQTDEVRKHVAEGKLPVQLAMSYDGRISFVLTEHMGVRKLAFLEGVFDDRGDDETGFDADVTIATGELRRMIPALISALGGVNNDLFGGA